MAIYKPEICHFYAELAKIAIEPRTVGLLGKFLTGWSPTHLLQLQVNRKEKLGIRITELARVKMKWIIWRRNVEKDELLKAYKDELNTYIA